LKLKETLCNKWYKVFSCNGTNLALITHTCLSQCLIHIDKGFNDL
jgi:hypothetical protein